MTASGYDRLVDEIRRFNDERDWGQFHDPKSLILALTGEVGELAELFQWVPAAEARDSFASGWRQQRAGEEIGDILIYLMQLADQLGLDAVEAARRKLEAAAEKFPAQEFRSTAPVKR